MQLLCSSLDRVLWISHFGPKRFVSTLINEPTGRIKVGSGDTFTAQGRGDARCQALHMSGRNLQDTNFAFHPIQQQLEGAEVRLAS